MLFASSVVKSEVLANYVRRHQASLITPGMDTNEIWTKYLTFVGSQGKNNKRSDFENAWLDTLLGGTPGGKTIADKWQTYLSKQGYKGTLPNMLRQFFTNS